MALHLDPGDFSDAEREERQQGTPARLELRPAQRVAHLGIRSLACPACGVPIAIGSPIKLRETLACAFCESTAPAREFLQARGWPEVDVIARLD
ncbi:MAG: hypothetical protein EXQ70_03545 [Solirubrobacterales bacterium]|nr:hypothetical protein [Solirubrobacterales bacterium]